MNTDALVDRELAGPPARRLLAAYVEEIRCEALRLLRNPGLAFPVLVMPVALYALIALVVAAEATAKDPTVGVFLFSAFAVMAITLRSPRLWSRWKPAPCSLGILFRRLDPRLCRPKRLSPKRSPRDWAFQHLLVPHMREPSPGW